MTREELITQLQPVIQDVFNSPGLIIEDSLNAGNLDAWTSLSFMQLLTAIETKYNFKFRIMEIPMLDNMGHIIEATLRHLSDSHV